MRLRHTLEAVKEATSVVSAKLRPDLDHDRTLPLALMKLIENIGEPASKVSVNSRDQHPKIPLNVVITMRNRLIHAYFAVENEVLWQTIVEDIPPLIEALETIVPEF